MPAAIGLSYSSCCSNLFNSKADVPNCDALASADSPSLIYVRLIECLFCLPLLLFGHCCSSSVTLCPSLSLSFRLRRKRSLPCCISPLPPSLPNHSLPLVLSPDRYIKFGHPSPDYNQFPRQKAKNPENPDFQPVLELYLPRVTQTFIKKYQYPFPTARQQLPIVHVSSYRPLKLPYTYYTKYTCYFPFHPNLLPYLHILVHIQHTLPMLHVVRVKGPGHLLLHASCIPHVPPINPQPRQFGLLSSPQLTGKND